MAIRVDVSLFSLKTLNEACGWIQAYQASPAVNRSREGAVAQHGHGRDGVERMAMFTTGVMSSEIFSNGASWNDPELLQLTAT